MLSLPRTGLPSVNAPSSLTRNQVPNSSAFVRARHTRVRGARSTTRFSIRSVLTVSLAAGVLTAMGLFLRNQVEVPLFDMQHWCCVSYPPLRLNATPMLRFLWRRYQAEEVAAGLCLQGRRDVTAPASP